MSTYALPDERGHFGKYGGIFVAETLMEPLAELRPNLILPKTESTVKDILNSLPESPKVALFES